MQRVTTDLYDVTGGKASARHLNIKISPGVWKESRELPRIVTFSGAAADHIVCYVIRNKINKYNKNYIYIKTT